MIGVALLLLAAQAASSPQPPQLPNLTITARKEKKRVSSLIRSIVAEADGRQLARFEEGVCPGVVGGSQAFGETMVRLVRENMAAAGAKLKPEGCRVSALLAFSADPAYTVRTMFDGRWGTSRFLDRFRRDRLLNGDDAIRSLQLTRMVATGGGPVDADVGVSPVIRNVYASRIKPASRHDAFFAIAIIDTSAAPGRTLRQLADVATMHLLLDIEPDAARKTEDSILALFSHPQSHAPDAMTALDRGMLKGLYGAASNDQHGYYQRGRMASEVRAARAKATADE